jgi:predicted regulator of Ras-like GTPase activity (Roadblock/LC7/MglB family)
MEKVKAGIDGMGSLMCSAVPPVPPTPSGRPPRWTAPTRSASSPPPAPPNPNISTGPVSPAPTADAVAASAILDELVATFGDVRAAVLASVDGFGVARNRSMSDEASHPAMLAAAIGLAHQLVAMGGGTQLRQFVVDHDGGLMLVWPIGDQRVVAVLATRTVDQRRVRSFVEGRAESLAKAAS